MSIQERLTHLRSSFDDLRAFQESKFEEIINAVRNPFPQCCREIVVKPANASWTNVSRRQPEIFTTYKMQPGLINGRSHYESEDGRWIVTFCGKHWIIQGESSWYGLLNLVLTVF